ncbi:hypothetical protein PG985_010377 [Apiospora marii]|uniref:Uncharacterized protein n=1 Tax=Apiospora marii TaxID=335849 RepID=A0ABR1RN04_9PEZI
MFEKLRFWNKWVKESSDGPYGQFLDHVLNEAVFWCTVVLLITITAVILGWQLAASRYTDPDSEESAAFLGLLWQALLQLLANYCTVVPVLREQRQRKKGPYSSSSHNRQAIIKVHYVVFYGCVVGSLVATILAPILLKAG